MQDEKFDAIVVGAGPAGIAAAITMAKAGLQVAVLEKGEKPGAKNVMGGILYRHNLEEVVGDAWKEAPVERPMIEEQRWFMTDDAALRLLGHKNLRHKEHPNSWSVLRARFDPWFASQAEAAGAFVINETVVESLILRDGRVVGVTTGREGDLFADVVVVCEGIGLGMRLLERAGLKKAMRPDQAAIAVKEIMTLDPERIEDRFNCEPGEGCAIECYGSSTFGKSGFMFIYTNKDTLSVGGGVLVSDYNGGVVGPRDVGRVDHGIVSPNELMEHFKNHPAIRPLLKGAETVEYMAKMIPEAGYKAMPRLYGNGYLVCGDAAMMANPVHREGSNLAMASGRMAGETVIQAKELADFSERTLSRYQGRIDNSWIGKDMKKYNGAVPLLEQNPELMGLYPGLLDRALDEFFRVDGVDKRTKQRTVLRMFRKEMGLKGLWTQVKAARAMGFLPP
ncbi:MAG TPA: FAD-dependent oxidoreductase [Candidatus Dormibacteraeota bacterium]|nr:FAD-dependent oxidoreductase [Candidatus Dormibacteraeota bacterium]